MGLFTIILKSPPFTVKNPTWPMVGDKPVGYLQRVVNLPLVSPRTNSFTNRVGDSNPGLLYSNPQL